MIAHGAIVPSHHTTVDVDIHSLCDFCVRGRGRGQRESGSSKHRVGRRTQWNMLEGFIDIRRIWAAMPESDGVHGIGSYLHTKLS